MTDMVPTPADGSQRAARLFRWFLLGHLLVWTAIPTLTKPNPSLDMVEMVFLGHEWRINYPTHPPLPNWICEAVAVASRGGLWAQYLAAQIAMVLAFWAVWQLARQIVSARAALFAVCLLEGCLFYTVSGDLLNNNVALFPCWAMAVLYFYRGIRAGRIRSWLGLGLWLGLGMMTKYTTVLLVATMLLFGLVNPEARKAWRRPGPYLAILLAGLIFLPHAWRLAAEDFTAVRYAASHLPPDKQWTGYLWNPLGFVVYQVGMLLPLLLAAMPLTGFPWRLRRVRGPERFSRDFLATMVLVPFAAQLAISAFGNVPLRGAWGSYLWMFAGLLLLVCLEVSPAAAAWRRAWIVWAATAAVVAAGAAVMHVAGPYFLSKDAHHFRHHFPGRLLAAKVDAAWA
ncbi:MAG: glycosyltransferase family 39 protein [Thermoguttaceae bacterium]